MKSPRSNAILCAIYVLYLFLALSIVARGGFRAQDFDVHLAFAKRLLSGSFPQSVVGATNPPLLYLLAATSMRIFGESAGIQLLAGVFALLNCLALHLFWLCSRRLLPQANGLLALLFLATLPVFVTTSVVFSADALVCLPFFAFCYLNLRLLEAPKHPSIPMLMGSGAVQVLGGLAKYSFLGIAPAAFLFSWYLVHKRKCSGRQALAVFVLLFLLPSVINYSIFKSLKGSTSLGIEFPIPSGAMTFRSLLWPYGRDVELFSAPPYFDPIKSDGTQVRVTPDGDPDARGRPGYTILVNNRYSYPALLNLAINSDILNITHRRMADSNDFTRAGPLVKRNQLFQMASVIFGALFSVLVAVSLAVLSWSALGLSRNPNDATAPGFKAGPGASLPIDIALALVLPALGYFGLIVGLLPFVGIDVYYGGYWLPRLVLPALLVFGLVAFWLLARIDGSKLLRYFLLAIIVCKVLFHLGLQLL